MLATAFETTETRAKRKERCTCSPIGLNRRSGSAPRERDRIWKVSEDLLGVANFDGYFLSVNPAWTNLLGWTEDEIKAMHVSELRHPDDAAGRHRRARNPCAGVRDRAHGKPFPSSRRNWRWIAWTMTTDEGLIYVSVTTSHPTNNRPTRCGESDQQFRALVGRRDGLCLYMLEPDRHRVELECRRRTHQGLYGQRKSSAGIFRNFTRRPIAQAGLPNRSLATCRRHRTI